MKTFEKLVISGIILISFNLQARNVKLSSLKHYLNPSPKNDLSQVMILDRYNLIISKNSHNVVVDINQFEANEICCMHNNKGQKECEQLTSKEKFELPVFLPDILTLTKKFDPLAHIADSKENCQRWARKKINDNEWLCYDPRIAHQQWDFSVDGNLGYVLYWSSTPDLNGDIFYIQGGIVYSMSPDTRSYNTPSTPYEGASKNYFTFSARCGRHAGLGRTVFKIKVDRSSLPRI